MKINDFFWFNARMTTSIFQAGSVNLKRDVNKDFQEWDLIKGNYAEIDFPVIFKQDHGKKLADILGTGWPGLFLVSDRLKKILEDNELTGWKTFPIKVYDKKKNEVLGYHGFSIVGRCGSINYKKAEICERQSFPTGPFYKVYKGLYVGLDKWDGNDFFIPDESIFFIVTNKAAEILQKNKVTNLVLENLSNVEIDVDAVLNKNE